MQNLQFFIDQILKGRNIHISVLNLTGALNAPSTKLQFKNVIHSKRFCNIAKSTECGYRACLRCKLLANSKARSTKNSFVGQCIYGLYEGATPVIVDDTCVAIVYVGNAVVNEQKVKERIYKTCSHTKVNDSKLVAELENCEKITSAEELLQIAEIVSDYLKLLYRNTPKQTEERHWLVELMKNHAKQRFLEQITLKEIALTYQRNPKYLGRLFYKQTGVSFNQYCNTLGLEKAQTLLLQTDKKIIDIAMQCGFFNLTYFNRLFLKKYGVSPSKYREKHNQ